MPTGAEVDQLMRAASAFALFILAYLILRRYQKLALVAWLAVIAFVPVWVGVTARAYFPAATLVTLLVAISLLPTLRRVRWSVVDVIFVVIGITVVIELLVDRTTLSAAFDLITAWAAAYAVGRLIVMEVAVEWIYRAVAVTFTLVAALAVVEFLTGVNLFVTYLPNDTRLFDIWGPLQTRGEVVRVEGAFGHSIALGATLGFAASIALGAALRPLYKALMILIMGAGVVLTFSRTGMLTFALAILLACVFQREGLSRAFRITLLVVTSISGLLVFQLVRDVFLTSGNEAQNSALYRAELLELTTSMSPFGLSPAFQISASRQVSIGDFGSVDNALLLFGLIYGWVPLLLVLGCLGAAVGYTLRRRATPAVLAVVAQLPALVTVALITQYAHVLWFGVGLAVSAQLSGRHRSAPGPNTTWTGQHPGPAIAHPVTVRPREVTRP